MASSRPRPTATRSPTARRPPSPAAPRALRPAASTSPPAAPAAGRPQNLDAPIFSGSYGADPDGVPYQLFSPDLGRGLLLNGVTAAPAKAAARSPTRRLPGPTRRRATRTTTCARCRRLRGAARRRRRRQHRARPGRVRARLRRRLARPRPRRALDLRGAHRRRRPKSRWGRLRPGPAEPLRVVGGRPGSACSTPSPRAPPSPPRPARSPPTAPASTSPTRRRQPLPARRGGAKQVDARGRGRGDASRPPAPTARVAFFTKAGHLWRYEAASDAATDLTPAGEVVGVLGASADGSHVYYLDRRRPLPLARGHRRPKSPPRADPGNYPPATGTARVSADGTHLALPLRAPRSPATTTPTRKPACPTPRSSSTTPRRRALRCVSCKPNGDPPDRPLDDPRRERRTAAARRHRRLQAPRPLGRRQPRLLRLRDALVAPDTNNAPRRL